MKKNEIARRLAREAGLTHAEAADRLDRTASQILAALRQGKTAALPGLGSLRRGRDGKLVFRKEGSGRE